MERKLVKQGRNALTVTLPAAWIKTRHLSAGDMVFLAAHRNDLLVSSATKGGKKAATLLVQGWETSQIYHGVQGKYIEGYDLITLHHHRGAPIHAVAATMLGMIIAEEQPTMTVLKSIIAVPEEDFLTILRRAGHILSNQAGLLPLIATGEATSDAIKQEEALLDYNLLYCLRYLNKYEAHEQAYKHFLLCATLEAAGDQISEIGKRIGQNKDLAQKVSKAVSTYVDLLFKKDFAAIYTALRSFRRSIGNRTFAEGLAFALAETLYNYIGYLVEDEHHI
jgi:antitoxin component of MazEF toxin-antitoxin module